MIEKKYDFCPQIVMSVCTCNDENQQKTVICYNDQCKSHWNEKLDYWDKVSKCSVHKTTMSIWENNIPPLCDNCKNFGYELVADYTENPWWPNWNLVKNNNGSKISGTNMII